MQGRWGRECEVWHQDSPKSTVHLDIGQLCLPTHDVFQSGYFEWMLARPCTTQLFSHLVTTLLVTQTAFWGQSLAWGPEPNKCKITHGLCPWELNLKRVSKLTVSQTQNLSSASFFPTQDFQALMECFWGWRVHIIQGKCLLWENWALESSGLAVENFLPWLKDHMQCQTPKQTVGSVSELQLCEMTGMSHDWQPEDSIQWVLHGRSNCFPIRLNWDPPPMSSKSKCLSPGWGTSNSGKLD